MTYVGTTLLLPSLPFHRGFACLLGGCVCKCTENKMKSSVWHMRSSNVRSLVAKSGRLCQNCEARGVMCVYVCIHF